MPTQPEALRLADLLESCPLAVGDAQQAVAAAELRRLHAERAAADGVINDLVAKVRELQKENESLAAALASSCDEQRHELWESGGIAGCERARVAERQRDALLEVLRALVRNEGLDAYSYLDKGIGTATAAGQRWLNARAAIKAVEGEKT